MDAGDYTGDATVPGRMQTDALVEAMNGLGYQVANLSQRELLHGYDAFLQWKKKSRFELISANLVWQDTGEPLVAPTTVRKVALRDGAKAREVRIGFIGLTRNNPAFQKEGPGGRRIVTVDPFAAAEKLVPALKAKSDIIVALSSLDVNEARLLPKRAKEIDLVLGGNGAMQTRTDDFPEDSKIGKASILYVGDQGKFMGEVRLVVDARKALASTQRALIGLTRDWPEDETLAKLMETTKLAINDYNKAQTEAASPFAAPPAAGPAAAPPPGHAAAPAGTPGGAAAGGGYTGSARCGTCHATEYDVWSRSGHARAWQALVKAHQDYNPTCVGCHSVGFGKPQGFVSASATPLLIDVGCESCHGPSGGHPEAVGNGYGATDTRFCITCHTAENSPDFVPALYVPKIRHWGQAKGGH